MRIQSVRYVNFSAVCNDPNVHSAMYAAIKNGGELVAPLLNTVHQMVLPMLVAEAINKLVIGIVPNISTEQAFDVLDRIDVLPHNVLIDMDN